MNLDIPQIFICYAHRDNDSSDPSKCWLNRLLEHLEPLQLQEQAAIWSDQRIELGEEWHEEIQTTLKQVKAAILLVSPAFLASKYIRNSEVPVLLKNAKDRGVIILPILLRECLWKETKFKYSDSQTGDQELSLSVFQMATGQPLNSLAEHEQDRVLYQIAKRVYDIVHKKEENQPTPVSTNYKTTTNNDERKSMQNTGIKKILLLSANPKNTSRLRLDEEVREIKEGLRCSRHRDRYIIETAEAVRIKDLRRAILDSEPNIIHFSGHGIGEQGLVFEDETGQVKLVKAEALANLFKLFSQIECIILNACYSEVQANAIVEYIPYVIGMDKAIGDTAAIEFAVGFYDALGAGRNVEFAYDLGCSAIETAGIPEHLTPKLLVSSTTTPPPPLTSPSNPPSRVQQIHVESLRNRLKLLEADYQVVEKQFNSTLNAQDRNKLKLQKENILQEMSEIEQELNSLGG